MGVDLLSVSYEAFTTQVLGRFGWGFGELLELEVTIQGVVVVGEGEEMGRFLLNVMDGELKFVQRKAKALEISVFPGDVNLGERFRNPKTPNKTLSWRDQIAILHGEQIEANHPIQIQIQIQIQSNPTQYRSPAKARSKE